MSKVNIAIMTLGQDLHGLAIKKYLEENYLVTCYIIAVDMLALRADLSWSNVSSFIPRLRSLTGEYIEIGELDAIWYRRSPKMQDLPSKIVDPTHIKLIENDCETSLLGLLLNDFSGVWVSHPDATRAAGNKLLQLRAAREAGFRIPQTLVSQNPEQIRRFCARFKNQVIVKYVKGHCKLATSTTILQPELLAYDEILRLTPTIYQECITGKYHLRVQCFGDEIHAALLEADVLDWRFNLNIPMSKIDLEQALETQLQKVLKLLNLRMGIFDLKLTEDGEPVWLEVNPQGQFLFLEGLCGIPLIKAMSDFLYSEAQRGAKRRYVSENTASSIAA